MANWINGNYAHASDCSCIDGMDNCSCIFEVAREWEKANALESATGMNLMPKMMDLQARLDLANYKLSIARNGLAAMLREES